MSEELEKDSEKVDKVFDRISRAGSPILSDKPEILDLLKNGAFCRILCQLLKESDNKLTQVGRSDLSNETAIKNSIKVQGEAIGLSRAVEYIIEFANITEEK